MYNRLVVSPGNALDLGTQGGVLLLAPPGQVPGAMSLTDLQNRTWHLLRENGPDNGYRAPTTGDFPLQVVTRDLNIAYADFISQTGISPGLVERADTFPVFAIQDMPVPPGLQSITMIEYNPYGALSYYLEPVSLAEFVRTTGGIIPPTVGQPRYYREPFAGYIRLQPVPGPGQAVGAAAGTLTVNGPPSMGQQFTATLVMPGLSPVVVGPYTALMTDTDATIALALSSMINQSSAVSGAGAFCAPTMVTANQIAVQALTPPGTSITIAGAATGTGATISPTAATNLSPTGDTMTWYYTAAGNLLVNPGDTPSMPPQFHMALVYRVLSDYWERKADAGQGQRYMQKFLADVARGKTYTFDSNRASQPTIAGPRDEGATFLGY